MKKRSLLVLSSISSLLLVAGFLGGALALTEHPAMANADMDRQFALESVGYLRALDNVDGLFADYVAAAYKDYFSRQSRFTLQDLSKADLILSNSKIPYAQLIEDPAILSQLARAMRSETILRTKIFKEGPQYRFQIEWLYAPKMDLISTESFVLTEPRDGGSFGLGDVQGALQSALDRLIKKLPFVGQITGRDEDSVTINIGANAHLKRGDTLVVGTVEEVKRHPLLKTIVDWRLNQTGRLEVETVDEGLAFCRVVQEEPGRQISRYQKIVQIIEKPVKQIPVVVEETDEKTRMREEPPRLGWVMGTLWLGNNSRDYASSSGPSGVTGGGFLYGLKMDGQLWFTREWFSELGLGYGSSAYGQQDISTGADQNIASTQSHVINFKVDVGYTYFASGELFGPKGWAKLGYHSIAFGMPSLSSSNMGSATFNGLFLGIGGDLPIRDRWGAMLSLDFGFLTGADAKQLTNSAVTGSSDVGFFAGGYYRYGPRTSIRFGLDVNAGSADFESGSTLTHKVISIGPSLMYYF